MKLHKELRLHKHIDELYKWKNSEPFIPPFVEISPISYCNQKCKFCYTTHLMKKLEKMPTEIMKKIFTEFSIVGIKGLRIQGIGEPTLHPDLAECINLAGKTVVKKKYDGGLVESKIDIALTTNGVLLKPKMIQECIENLFSVKISVIDSSKKRYSEFHRVDENQWNLVVKNIEYATNFIKASNLKCNFHTTIYAEDTTYENLFEITNFCKNLGFSLVTISNALYSPRTPNPNSKNTDFKKLEDHENYLKNLETKLLDLEDKDFSVDLCMRNSKGVQRSYVDESKKINCPGINFSTVIDAKGFIYPCWRYWGKEEYSYGNLHENTFLDIWMSENRIKVNKKMSEEYYSESTCVPCSHNRINEQLLELQRSTGWENFLS